MDSLETMIDQIVELLQRLYSAPAILLVLFTCWVLGYALRCIRKFPNDGIPIAVILWGGVLAPFIADTNSTLPLRVWILRNILVGLVCGFVAWLVHNKVLSKVEERLGLFGGKNDGSVPIKTVTPPPATPPIPDVPIGKV
jgi:hypothetical protein